VETQQHQLSVSGVMIKHVLSFCSIFDQQGIVETNWLQRYTGRVNIENSFSNFKVGLNTSLDIRVSGTMKVIRMWGAH
jgi:hypothetical protein